MAKERKTSEAYLERELATIEDGFLEGVGHFLQLRLGALARCQELVQNLRQQPLARGRLDKVLACMCRHEFQTFLSLPRGHRNRLQTWVVEALSLQGSSGARARMHVHLQARDCAGYCERESGDERGRDYYNAQLVGRCKTAWHPVQPGGVCRDSWLPAHASTLARCASCTSNQQQGFISSADSVHAPWSLKTRATGDQSKALVQKQRCWLQQPRDAFSQLYPKLCQGNHPANWNLDLNLRPSDKQT